MKKVALFGYSGHAFVVAEALLLCGYQIAGYYDRKEVAENPFNLPYLGSENNSVVLSNFRSFAEAAALCIGDNTIRRKIFELLQEIDIRSIVVQHPAAIVSGLATVGAGTFIAAGSIVNPLAKIGKGAILNTGCIIEHECSISDFTHIAPGAVLAGNVTVGENSFIGANSVIKQGITIGKNVIIGAGSVVLKDVPDNETRAGNPAKNLRR
ncbi:MAG: acetyltransferase [Chitinophagaceae bacterium]|nr:MAG: acetyltransferase [Chitinophagaceae bacterium]